MYPAPPVTKILRGDVAKSRPQPAANTVIISMSAVLSGLIIPGTVQAQPRRCQRDQVIGFQDIRYVHIDRFA